MKNDQFKESVNAFVSSLIKKDYAEAEKKLQDCLSVKIKERITNTLPQK